MDNQQINLRIKSLATIVFLSVAVAGCDDIDEDNGASLI